MQTALPIILCSLTCLVLIISHFIPHEANTVVFSEIKGNWYAVIKVAGYAIATLAVLRSHIRRLQARTTDWQYSTVALVCFLVFPLTYLFDNIRENNGLFVTTNFSDSDITDTSVLRDATVQLELLTGETYSGKVSKIDGKKRRLTVKLDLAISDLGKSSQSLRIGEQSLQLSVGETTIIPSKLMTVKRRGLFFQGLGRPLSIKKDGVVTSWVYDNVVSPLDTTMFALVAFYICSAAYRSFRVRNFEAGVLLATGIIVMLVNSPPTSLIWDGVFPAKTAVDQFFVDKALINLKDWLLAVPGQAASRAILIGGALGLVTQSLRVLFGIERSWLG